MGREKGALASPLRLQRTTSTPTYVLSFAHVCASKTRGGSLGLRTYSMTPGATRLSKLVGCALSRSVFSLWQSPHSACKVCMLPAKACLTGTMVQLAGARQPAAAQRALAALRGQGLLPLRRAGTSRFALSSFKKISCAKPARRWPLYSFRSTSCSSGSSRILVPRLSLSLQYAPGC